MLDRWLILATLATLAACGDDGTPSTNDAMPGATDAPPLPANTWTWLPIDGATCANGTPTGIGINVPTAPAEDVFVYFQGGGACWDHDTCFVQKTAVNIEVAYDAAKFAADWGNPAVDRAPTNPFAKAALVYVPYCTGDLHAGIDTRTYGDRTVHHAGATNAQHIVDTLHAMYPAAKHVWIGGSSAGGYGATFNQHRFAAAWPTLDVHVMQDGSPFVPVLANYATWRTAWSLQYPPDCGQCDTDLPRVIDAVVAAHPNARLALMHFDDDPVIKAYFGYTGSLVPATDDLLANHYDHPSTHAFVIGGQGHTMFGRADLSAEGVPLTTWLVQWATGDAAWRTVRQ